jgi:hypothetical protein
MASAAEFIAALRKAELHSVFSGGSVNITLTSVRCSFGDHQFQ